MLELRCQADHGVEAVFQRLDPSGVSTATDPAESAVWTRVGNRWGTGGTPGSGSGTLRKEELLSILSGLGISDPELPGSPCHVFGIFWHFLLADDHNPVPGCTCII